MTHDLPVLNGQLLLSIHYYACCQTCHLCNNYIASVQNFRSNLVPTAQYVDY
jgi:hypothetical protein